MYFTFSFTIVERTDNEIKVLYTPTDNRLQEMTKVLDVEYITPDSPLEEVTAFIELRAPQFEWEQHLREVDPIYKQEMEECEAHAKKIISVTTL